MPHGAAYWSGAWWRSHLDQFEFSERENRHLGDDIEAAGGKCLLDMRVRPGGSHHQKFAVLRRNGRPEEDVAFVGGIDLCHGRHDDAGHGGDPQAQPMAASYGTGRPGMTSSSRSAARRSGTWRPYSASDGRIRLR